MQWILLVPVLIFFIYFVLIKPFLFWRNKGIKQLGLATIWKENLRTVLQTRPLAEFVDEMYNAFPNDRYFGTYQFFKPVLLVRDLDLIKQIGVKDFDHFVDHMMFLPEDVEPLFGKGLMALKGEQWKDMRATLSPCFTSSKMRAMFCLMAESAQQFVNYFDTGNSETITLEMKDAFTKYTNDVIASTAFGISCDSLKEPNNEFYIMGKKAISGFRGFWNNVTFLIIFIAPKLAKMLGITLFGKKLSEFFNRLVKNNIESREKSGIVRPDIIHLLMEAKKGRLKHECDTTQIPDSGFAVIEESSIGKEERRHKRQLTDDDIVSQAFLFFLGGFDGISTLLCFATYELAVNPDIQSRLRDEADNTFKECDGKLTYEALLKMKYLDMVISEIMRKWSVAPMIDRICVKPYTIEPVGNDEKPIHLNQGDMVWFPAFGIHRDPQFYPEPERFDPERFSDENKSNINPYSYIPFGIGPRSCIGNRFALLESKVVLCYLIRKFDILVTDKTTVPLKLARDQLSLTAANGFWFGLKLRSGVK